MGNFKPDYSKPLPIWRRVIVDFGCSWNLLPHVEQHWSDHTREWRKRNCERKGRSPDHCWRRAHYDVAGSVLCRLHAGHYVLEILTNVGKPNVD